ncbi:ABC transporter ATPase [Bifidobacterium longum subsp. longum]|uniref:ABC transporter ATPase n=1 Tax=Bifidobacterium longum subsp. longum TaxID=1679 RepID=A0A4R0W9L4_BIFLL|nr:ABC transporter ATPase [Bifidobacterium longum subsp. longum]
MSGPGERRRVVDLYSATPMAAARVAERLGYPTGQCLECRPAKDPGYAGHMARPIVPLETGAKAIEPVPGGMRGSGPPNCSARASARSTTGSRRIAGAVWPRCGPKTGTPANPKHRLD